MRHLQPLVASDRRPLGLLVPSGLGSSVGLGKVHFLFRLRFFFSPAMCPSIRILAVPHLTQRCQSVLPRFCAPLSFIPPQSLSAYAHTSHPGLHYLTLTALLTMMGMPVGSLMSPLISLLLLQTISIPAALWVAQDDHCEFELKLG